MFVPAERLIVEAAINEQSSKSENPHVPISAEECAADALAAAEAGAATEKGIQYSVAVREPGHVRAPATPAETLAILGLPDLTGP